MASQEDTQEGDAKAKLLAQAFWEELLDAEYWVPKVSQILGVKCREALQHVEYKDYLKLECEVRNWWEKKALQKLLKITENKTASKDLQKQCLQKTKQRQEVAKQALKDVREMLNSRSHSQEALREKAETLWQAMEIPKEFWPAPKTPLADMLEGIQKQLDQQELSAGSRENIPDTEVLRRASGGLALQGIYRTSRPEDVLAKREQLLRVPERFQLAGPEQGSLLERKEFFSSVEESTFTRSMEQLGFSISVSAKAVFWGINLGVSVDHSSSSHSQDTHQSRSEQSYFCTTMYQYIPLASGCLETHQLLLSDEALRELQDMEQLLRDTQEEDKAPLLNRCESFFSRFGSHVNQGPLHFGGIFWWKASTEGFRAEQWEEMKRQTSEALNSLVWDSNCDFGALDVSKSSSQASVLGRAGKSSHTAIQLDVDNTGGPDTASLPQWRTGLECDNTTWCVIDRGFELIPVWDIILWNHRRDFKSVGQMSRALRDAYKALTNQSISTVFGEQLGSAMQEARDFMETVKTWEVTVDERKLLMLMELKDDLNAKTWNPSVWINVCLSDKALQDFLVNTVRTCQESPPDNITSIKVMLKSLLDPHIYSVRDFPEASFIMQWIFQTEHPLPRSPNVSELEELIKTLQQMQEHIRAVTYAPGSSASAVHEAKVEATLTISLAIHSLLQSLQERAQEDMESLVLIFATGAGYQVRSSTFRHLLGHPEMQCMAKSAEAAQKYVYLEEQDADRAEASLSLTGLTVTPEREELSPEPITVFAHFLCAEIEPGLREAVYERTARDIANDLQGNCPDFRGCRATLEVYILRYLAEEENFEYFREYMHFPKQFVQRYIETKVQRYCLGGSRRLEKFLGSSLTLLYGQILSAVSSSTQILKDRKDREDKISLWLDAFCRDLRDVILPRRYLKFLEYLEVTDFEFLSSAMAKALDDLRDRLMKEFAAADMSSFSTQPHTMLVEHFSGCWEQCPFCGAVCSSSLCNPGDHQAVFHRPEVLNLWNTSNHLTIDFCSNLVASNRSFRVDKDKWIPYRRYWEAGPPFSTWKIFPDRFMKAYWKWFVCRFRTQLEVLYDRKFQGKAEIPEAWWRITKQEALSALDKW